MIIIKQPHRDLVFQPEWQTLLLSFSEAVQNRCTLSLFPLLNKSPRHINPYVHQGVCVPGGHSGLVFSTHFDKRHGHGTKGQSIFPSKTKNRKTEHKKTVAKSYVIKGDSCTLLGYNTANELGLIKVVSAVSSPTDGRVANEVIETYPELFQGMGKLKDFQLHINKDIQPTCQPHRRVRFHVRQKVEEELKSLRRKTSLRWSQALCHGFPQSSHHPSQRTRTT